MTEQEEAWTSPDDTELGNDRLEPSSLGVVTTPTEEVRIRVAAVSVVLIYLY